MKKLFTFVLLFIATVSYSQYNMYVVPKENYIESASSDITYFNSIVNPYAIGTFEVKVVDSYYLDIHEITPANERVRFYGRISKNLEENTFTLDDMISGKVYKMVITSDGDLFYLDDLRSEQYFFKINKFK